MNVRNNYGKYDYVSAAGRICGRKLAATKMESRAPRTLTAIKMTKEISRQVASSRSKVTVVGCGQVGMAAAFSMLTLGVCSDLALCDIRKDAAIGEKMDLLHGLAFLGRQVHIEADSDFSISEVCLLLI